MTSSPLTDVGPTLTARPYARRWENTIPYVPHGELKRPSAGHHLRRIVPALLAAFAFAVVGQWRCSRRPKPLIHRLGVAEELRFALWCQQITHTRQGAET